MNPTVELPAADDPLAGLQTDFRERVYYTALRGLSDPLGRLRIAARRLRTRFLYDSSCRQLGAARAAEDGAPLRYSAAVQQEIAESVRRANLGPAEPLEVDASEFSEYLERAQFDRRYRDYLSFYSGFLRKKLLEQFLATKLLRFDETDVFVDVASERSPFHEIVARLYGSETYSQDLCYAAGVQNRRIGSRASSLPLPDHSVSKISVLCSFEHFEGSEDTAFVRECGRLLRPGGAVAILPLYMAPQFVNYTEPAWSLQGEVPFDEGAELRATRRWWNRFLRYYSPEKLAERVLVPAEEDFDVTIYSFVNSEQFDPSQFVAYGLLLRKRQ